MSQRESGSVRPRAGRSPLMFLGAPAVVVTLAAVLVLALTVAPSPAAASHHRAHHVRHSCQGFANPVPHVAVWKSYRSENSPLPRNIGKLICSVADGATIDIKSWFFKINDAFTRSLVARLALMHRYHHVRVDVFVGRNGRGTSTGRRSASSSASPTSAGAPRRARRRRRMASPTRSGSRCRGCAAASRRCSRRRSTGRTSSSRTCSSRASS